MCGGDWEVGVKQLVFKLNIKNYFEAEAQVFYKHSSQDVKIFNLMK